MERVQWEAGRLIDQARVRKGISKIDATRAIGMSESWWRKMELGYHTINGQPTTYRPTPEAMVKAAHLVGLDPAEILKIGGYAVDPDLTEIPALREQLADIAEELPDGLVKIALAYVQGLADGHQVKR